MAVQLARLSLWLTTMSGDRPLTFFDHNLRAGNSLAGASIADVQHRPVGRDGLQRHHCRCFDADHDGALRREAVTTSHALRDGLEDTIEQVRAKGGALCRSPSPGAPLSRWKALADLWCAGWFDSEARNVTRSTFAALTAALTDDALGRAGGLGRATIEKVIQAGRAAAARERFFHWELEFTDVFHGVDGAPLAQPGFDAIVGNPPWEMLRGDAGDAHTRERKADDGSRLTKFARGSGIYRLQGGGHANLYQMFVERTLSLVRRDGRLGLILPSGFASDHGCASLRRQVLDQTTVDSFVVVENREGLFPIHRAVKFVLMTLTKSRASAAADGSSVLPLRCGIRSAAQFDELPEIGEDPHAVRVPRKLIEQLSGEQLAIPELRTAADAAIAARIAFRFPGCGDEAGWNLQFGRELNASDDRSLQPVRRGLPIIEGKHIAPFPLDTARRHRLHPASAGRGRLGDGPFERPRLAYRDVASSTNRADADRRASCRQADHHAHALLPQGSAGGRGSAQHFICGISTASSPTSGSSASDHARDRRDRPAPAVPGLRRGPGHLPNCESRAAARRPSRGSRQPWRNCRQPRRKLYELDADFVHVLGRFH